jgi:hypothetical protein
MQSAVFAYLNRPHDNFGVRPPELRFVKNQALYFRCFHCKKGVRKFDDALLLHATLVKKDLYDSGWVDGLNARVRLRQKAIPELTEYVEKNRVHFAINRKLAGMILKLKS